MAYTKSQAMAKNATPSTPTPSKKISKQGKRRAPPAKSELPPKKPFKSAPSSSKPHRKKIFHLPTFPSEILEPWTTVDADPTSSDEAEE